MTFRDLFDKIVQSQRKGVDILNTINFKELNADDFFVKNIICDFQVWEKNNSWSTPEKGRINSAVMMLLAKNAVYTLENDEKVYAYCGDAVILPKGSVYTCNFYDCDNTIELRYQGVLRSCLFLGFELFDTNFENITFSGKPQVILSGRNNELVRSFEHLGRLCKSPDCSKGMLGAQTHTFLASLCEKYNASLSGSDSDTFFDKIKQYIYENSHTATVEDLIKISEMSPSTLRRRFSAEFGVSPVAYINSVKIQKAKSFFESGVTKIRDVSILCGIEDEFYFSRLFTKITGISPSEYLKRINNLNK